MSSMTEEASQLDEFLEELTRVAYHQGPVPFEMVQQFCEKIVVAIADGDVRTIEKLRSWFIMLPTEGSFAVNVAGEPTDLRDLMGLLDVARDLVIPAGIAREVRESQYMRTVIEFVAITGPSMGYQIAKPFHLDEEEVHKVATDLRGRGFLTGTMTHEQDPGFTWTLTPRGRRLYEALYK